MYFSDWRVLLRRWYAVVLGLLLTAGLGCSAVVLVPVQYKVEAEVLLLPPKKAVLKGGNPYLYLDGLSGIQDVLSRTMSDAVTGRALLEDGATGVHSIVPDPLSAGPVLVVGVEDSTPEDALRSLGLVLDRIPVALRDIQTSAQVPDGWMVTSTVITEDDRAQLLRKTQLRAVVAGVAAGLAATVMGACLLDSFLQRRRRRRKDPENGGARHCPGPSRSTDGSLPVG
ncbi:MAG: hypothetical protein QG608_1033 [Actinomycetota bacterium]|nr:hypothetical protein [Actinomycetota bacterium]